LTSTSIQLLWRGPNDIVKFYASQLIVHSAFRAGIRDYDPAYRGRFVKKSSDLVFAAQASGLNASSPTEDRRPKRRVRILRVGIVTYSNGTRSFRCAVRDISENGAHISVPNGATFPDRFILLVVQLRTAYDAVVVWRDQGGAGLKLERSIALGQDIDPKLAYLNKLWQGSALRVGGHDG
jgi:hypothetical protein